MYTVYMAFHIRNSDAEDALRRLCELTGESLTEAVLKSVNLRLQAELKAREEPEGRKQRLLEKYRLVRKRIASQPVLDPRTPDEILGYGEDGLPT